MQNRTRNCKNESDSAVEVEGRGTGERERERGEVWSSWSARMDPTFKDCHVARLWGSSTCGIFRRESVELEFKVGYGLCFCKIDYLS